mmetsp:Transcript_4691/g.8960  ORF Transcript_4691/g.8960 Transcript_4691/m.8960 type:complete len:324 (+) Transcript_4691:47-1018(+)
MESAAIDFVSLLKEERRKARLKKQGVAAAPCVSDKSSTATTPSSSSRFPYPSWNLPNLHPKDVQGLDSGTHLLSKDPPFLYYIENFLPYDDFATGLVSWLQGLPEARKQSTRGGGGGATQEQNDGDEYSQAHGKWTKLRYAARRVALFDARVAPLPEPLQHLVHVLHETVWQHIPPTKDEDDATTKIGPINHILINEYTETQGILGHTDGPAYDPCTATLSLESDAVLHFSPLITKRQPPKAPQQDDTNSHQVWLAANSLVVFTHQLYRDYRHAIADGAQPTLEHLTASCWNGTPGQAVRRGPLRYSLTFRCKRNSSSPGGAS